MVQYISLVFGALSDALCVVIILRALLYIIFCI